MSIRIILELNRAGMNRVLKDAKARVAKENLQQGVVITVAEKGQVVQIRPDKTRRELGKKLKPRVTITQTKFRLD